MKLTIFGLLSYILIVTSFKFPSQSKLIIDQDGGADDAMAIFIALLREKYFNGPQVIGITTVRGNVNESQVFENTQRILDVARRQDIPIFRGCRGALVQGYPSDYFFGYDGLGDNENVTYRSVKANPKSATTALIELSKKYQGNLIVVALAPLTNIAITVRQDPDFISRLKHLYVGAGHVYDSRFSEPEFNVQLDAESYYILTEVATPGTVTMASFSGILQSVEISADWRVNELGAIDTRIMKAQNAYERVSLPQSAKWQLLDPTVMALALDNQMITSAVPTRNSVILCGNQRGINTNDFNSSNPNMILVNSTSEDYFKSFLLQTFSANSK